MESAWFSAKQRNKRYGSAARTEPCFIPVCEFMKSFLSTMLKYVPKRLHFHRNSYQARVALTVGLLDHNLNVG